MATKDVQAREKAQSVEARHAALVGRTGTVEAQASTLQSQVTSLQAQVASLNSLVAAINTRLGDTNFAGLRALTSTGFTGGAPKLYASNGAGWLTNINDQVNSIIANLG